MGIPITFVAMAAYPLLTRAQPGGGWSSGVSCVFKSVTGLPCPTCGYTRSVQQVVDGNLLESLKFHPFGVGLLIFFGFLSMKCIAGLRTNRPYELPVKAAIGLAALLAGAWVVKLLWMTEYW